jgi:hypothetical protein
MGTVVVAPGFSCRMQIEHFTGQVALHPAQVLLQSIGRDKGSGIRESGIRDQ